MPKKPAPVTPTRKPSSRDELERRRTGVLATGPSGSVYRIRKVNIQRQALEGTLPRELRELALNVVSRSNGRDPMRELARQIDEEKLAELISETKSQNDRLVLATVIEPELVLEDLGTGELDDDPVLPAVDYEWLLAIAKGLEDRDAEQRMLWGPEPRNRMEIFQEAHNCAEDCKDCDEVIRQFTALAADAG
jgi:hypothetical protein